MELYPDEESLVVSGKDGRYFHELVIPFVSNMTPGQGKTAAGATAVYRSETPITPVSDWLYVKLYAGEALLEHHLRKAVSSIAAWLRSERLIDRWFFVRYADPWPHLRLRFHGDAGALRAVLLPKLESMLGDLLTYGSAWRVQYDSYRREVGRYGGERGTCYAEQLFAADSEAVLRLLTRHSQDWHNVRTIAAVVSVVNFAHDCRLSLLQLSNLLQSASAGSDAATRRRRSDAYRSSRSRIEAALWDAGSADEELASIRSIFDARSETNQAPVAAWLEECERVGTSRTHAIQSVVHMSLNRIGLRRDDEHDIYDFAFRAIRSRIARTAARGGATSAMPTGSVGNPAPCPGSTDGDIASVD